MCVLLTCRLSAVKYLMWPGCSLLHFFPLCLHQLCINTYFNGFGVQFEYWLLVQIWHTWSYSVYICFITLVILYIRAMFYYSLQCLLGHIQQFVFCWFIRPWMTVLRWLKLQIRLLKVFVCTHFTAGVILCATLCVHNEYTYTKVRRTIYSLPQAGKFSMINQCNILQKMDID